MNVSCLHQHLVRGLRVPSANGVDEARKGYGPERSNTVRHSPEIPGSPLKLHPDITC